MMRSLSTTVCPVQLVIALILVMACTDAVAGERVEVTANRLNVRAAPAITAPVIHQVSKGERLLIVAVSDDWARVDLGQRTAGFVSRRHVQPLPRSKGGRTKDEAAERIYPKDAREDRNVAAAWANKEISSALLLFMLVLAALIAKLIHAGTKQSGYRDTRLPESRRAPTLTPDRSSASRKTEQTPKATIADACEDQGLKIAEPDESVHELPLLRVRHVIDGDTVIVDGGWRETKIRLDSIDCPEDGQPWGDIATAGLIKMIGGKRVRVEEHGVDHYGRRLATLHVRAGLDAEWINVNEKMVAKGHAWVMRKYYGHLPRHRQQKLNRIEKWARMKKVGLWSTRNPIPPWRWRASAQKS